MYRLCAVFQCVDRHPRMQPNPETFVHRVRELFASNPGRDLFFCMPACYVKRFPPRMINSHTFILFAQEDAWLRGGGR